MKSNFPALAFTPNDHTHRPIQALARDLVARESALFLHGKVGARATVLPSINALAAVQPLAQRHDKLANVLLYARGDEPDPPLHLRKSKGAR